MYMFIHMCVYTYAYNTYIIFNACNGVVNNQRRCIKTYDRRPPTRYVHLYSVIILRINKRASYLRAVIVSCELFPFVSSINIIVIIAAATRHGFKRPSCCARWGKNRLRRNPLERVQSVVLRVYVSLVRRTLVFNRCSLYPCRDYNLTVADNIDTYKNRSVVLYRIRRDVF